MITIERNNTGERLILNPHLVWEDELTHTSHAQATGQLLEGALLIENSKKKGGRPITLTLKKVPKGIEGGVRRAEVLKIQEFAEASYNERLTLTIYGRPFGVVWRAEEGAPVEAQPLDRIANPAGDELLELTLRFLEVGK